MLKLTRKRAYWPAREGALVLLGKISVERPRSHLEEQLDEEVGVMNLAQKTNDLCDYGCTKLRTIARGSCVVFEFDV
jgi:hypothetical protein